MIDLASIFDNLLRTDGTNQLERVRPALDPEYFPIDERSLRDLLDFTYRLAEKIRFYDDNNLENGNWQSFFDLFADAGATQPLAVIEQKLAVRDDFEPHLALLVCFLKLFVALQNAQNRLTEKHLDHYYKNVLQLTAKPAQPDRVHVIFELAKNFSPQLVAAKTVLDAGKDDAGNPLRYETAEELVVNPAQIAQLKTVFVDRSTSVARIFAAPAANSADGLGKALSGNPARWSTFGESQLGLDAATRTMPDARLGWGLASPMLHLREGNRLVCANFIFDSTIFVPPTSFLSPMLDVFYTGEAGWAPVGQCWAGLLEDVYRVETKISGAIITTTTVVETSRISGDRSLVGQVSGTEAGPPERTLQLDPGPLPDTLRVYTRITTIATTPNSQALPDGATIEETRQFVLALVAPISESDPPCVAFNAALHEQQYDTPWPVLQVWLKPEENGYNTLSRFVLQATEINVQATGLTELVLQNESAVFNPGQPVQPFGSTPELNADFYIGSREVFQKKLDYLRLNFQWKEPPEDFSTHYQDSYHNGTTDVPIYGTVSQFDFTANLSYLFQRQWRSGFVSDHQLLFRGVTGDPQAIEIPQRNGFDVATAGFDYKRVPDLPEFSSWSPNSKFGFIKLSLSGPNKTNPPFRAFGHKRFLAAYTEQILALSKFQITPVGTKPPLPNEPYTPVLKEISLDYASTEIADFAGGIEKVFVSGPFGNHTFDPIENPNLLPQLDSEGYLYIGLSQFSPPQNISLLFKLAEGSAAPNVVLQPADITWSYLQNARWVALNNQEILTDTTRGFQTSGIIALSVGREASSQHVEMPGGQHWLRAEIRTGAAAASKVIAIHPQAVSATLMTDPTDVDRYDVHLGVGLPADRISKLAGRIPGIKSVGQPYNSFGGNASEAPLAFFTRSSERLRHKNRCLTPADYEKIVLEAFPGIFKVKCIPHTDLNGFFAPGTLTLIVVSNLRNQNAVNPLEPRTSQVVLDQIKEFLLPFANPYVQREPTRLRIENPIYETILLDFKVKFLPGLDPGFYTHLLNEDLKKFLSPWAFEEGQDILFGSRIYRSDLLTFVERRDYVDFVTDFKLFHLAVPPTLPFDLPPPFAVPEPGLPTMAIGDNFIVGPNLNIAVASNPKSILISHPQHRITALRPDEAACADTTAIGLGKMIIAIDFIVDHP